MSFASVVAILFALDIATAAFVLLQRHSSSYSDTRGILLLTGPLFVSQIALNFLLQSALLVIAAFCLLQIAVNFFLQFAHGKTANRKSDKSETAFLG